MKLSGVEKFAIVEVVAVVPLSMLLSVGVIVLGCRMLDVGDWWERSAAGVFMINPRRSEPMHEPRAYQIVWPAVACEIGGSGDCEHVTDEMTKWVIDVTSVSEVYPYLPLRRTNCFHCPGERGDFSGCESHGRSELTSEIK
jgi:hypothetical protein